NEFRPLMQPFQPAPLVIFAGLDYDGRDHCRPTICTVRSRPMSAEPVQVARSPLLSELQATLEREIPMCGQMGIRVRDGGHDGLLLSLPLSPNRNHQQTAFAGSLSSLCTIAGWGSVYI